MAVSAPLMLGTMPCCFSNDSQSLLVNWLPWSEWMIRPVAGFRFHTADTSACRQGRWSSGAASTTQPLALSKGRRSLPGKASPRRCGCTDVGDPYPVWRSGREVPIDDNFSHPRRTASMARLGAIANFCPYALCLHQTSNTMAAATFTFLTKFPGDLAVSIHRSACQPGVLDKFAQTINLTTTRPARIARPCIVATAVNPKHSTHGRQPEFAQLLTHESVLRRHPLAKYAAAFFRMSRSSVRRLTSAFKRRTSAESLGVGNIDPSVVPAKASLLALRSHW